MKMKILTVLIISVMALNCVKNDTAIPYNNFSGTWKNIGYSGGFAGLKFTPVPDSVKNFIQLDANRILFNNNGIQTCSGYTFVKDSANAQTGLLTISDTTFAIRQYDVSFQNDTLTLYPHNFADAFANHYAHNLQHFDWCDSTAH